MTVTATDNNPLDHIVPTFQRADNVFAAEYYDFSIWKLMNTLKEHGYDGYGARFKLHGYDLIICSRQKSYIRFSGGYLWIGSYGILATTFNEAYDSVVALISDVIDAGVPTDYHAVSIERFKERMLLSIANTTKEATDKNKKRIIK